MAVGDVNGDQLVDLATANANSGDVALFIRSAGMPLPTPRFLAVGDEPRSLAIADVNGDHSADLVTANSKSDDVSVLFGNGEGEFAGQRRVEVGDEPLALVVADLTAMARSTL